MGQKKLFTTLFWVLFKLGFELIHHWVVNNFGLANKKSLENLDSWMETLTPHLNQ